jgi:hypothetical protein
MKVGDLCKVCLHGIYNDQYGELVIITKPYISVKDTIYERGIPKGTDIPEYVEGMNLKTLNFHYYRKKELEAISESR